MYEVLKPFKIHKQEYKKGDIVKLSSSLVKSLKGKIKKYEKTDSKND